MSSERFIRWFALIAVICFIWAVSSAHCATFYVSTTGSDSNDGSEVTPWRHIEYAMTRPTLQPGDDIQVMGGTYRPDPVLPLTDPCYSSNSCIDDALIRPVTAGTSLNPIVVHKYNGLEVILTGRLVATGWTLDSGSVYYFDYTTPTGFPYDHPFQVVQNGALLFATSSRANVNTAGKWFADQAAKRLYVWCSDSASPDTHVMEYAVIRQSIDFTGSGIHDWRISDLTILGYRNYGISVTQGAGFIDVNHNDISYIGNGRPGADLSNGFAFTSLVNSSGTNRIRNNNFHNTLAESIHISQTDAGGDMIEFNDIHDCGGAEWQSDGYNGTALIGLGMIVRASNNMIRNNNILNNGYHGIDLESDLNGSEGVSHPSNNTVDSNIIIGNAGNGIYMDGKNGLTASSGNIISNNTIGVNNLRRGGTGDGEIRLRGNFDSTQVTGNTITSLTVVGLLIQSISTISGGAQGADAVPQHLNIASNRITYNGTSTLVYPVMLTGNLGTTFDQLDFDYITLSTAGAAWSWEGTLFFDLPRYTLATGFEVNGRLCRKL